MRICDYLQHIDIDNHDTYHGKEDNVNDMMGIYPSPNPKLNFEESNNNSGEYPIPPMVPINPKNNDANK